MNTRATKLSVAAIALLVIAMVAPIIWQLVSGSVVRTNIRGDYLGTTGKYFAQIFGDSANLTAVLNTLIFAAGSAAIAILLGGLQAWIAERTNAPLGRLAYLSTVILIGTPYLVYVISWVLVLGRNGLVNSVLQKVTGSTDPSIVTVQSLPGMILIEGLVWSPLAFLLVAGAFRNANPSYEEAARMCGASVRRVVWRVTLPLAWPAILAVGLLAFVRAAEAFEVPAVVGLPGGVDVITTRLYTAIHKGVPPDYGFANAISVVLMLVVGVLLWRYNKLSKRAERFQVVSGEAYRPARMDLGKWRWPMGLVSVTVFFAVAGLPLAVLAWVSVIPVYQGINESIFHFTLQNYATAIQSPSLAQGALNTVFLCAGAAVIAAVAACLIAWFVVRRAWGAGLLDQLVSVPLIIPGIVIGMAISQIALSAPFPFYGTIWVIGFGYLVTFLPFTMRFAYAGVIQIRADLEEAALVSGANRARIFRRIVLPLLGTSLLTGTLFSFLQGARALAMPIFLASPGNPVAAVSLYDLFFNGSTTQVAAFGVLWTVVMVGISVLLFALAGRSKVALF